MKWRTKRYPHVFQDRIRRAYIVEDKVVSIASRRHLCLHSADVTQLLATG